MAPAHGSGIVQALKHSISLVHASNGILLISWMAPQAVKAMRFEEAGNKKSALDTADTARERAKMIEEDALAAEEEGDF